MATIPTPGSELRHVRKTITFDGSAGNGAEGQVTAFSLTGRVMLERLTVFVAQDLVSAGAARFRLIGTTESSTLWGSWAYSDATAGLWMGELNNRPDFGEELVGSQHANGSAGWGPNAIPVNDTIVVLVQIADITAGELVIDAWYRPITDDGALAGDDIDQDSRTWFWAQALADIASVPAMTASALSGLNWLFALARNKRTQTATTETVYKDDGSTSLATSTKSDDGTTYTRGEYS